MEIHHPKIKTLQNEIYEFCCGYASKPGLGRTLVICGENGTGKSRVAKYVAHWANRIAMSIPLVSAESDVRLARCAFAHWPSKVDEFKSLNFSAMEDLESCELAVIDDIGAEHDPSSLGVEKLYLLLNRREWKWNLITTNIHPGDWDERFERRIASRLFRNATHFDLSDVPDYSTT